MPAFEQVYQDYAGQGLVILAVNLTSQDDITKVNAFADEYGLTFPILYDSTGEVAGIYESSALPTTYFINNLGEITEVVIGGPISETLLRIRVEELLGLE